MTEHVRQRLYLAKNKFLPVWSISFRDDPSCPIGVREDLAKNMVAEVAVRGAKVKNDFDRVPIFQRPIFNATWNDQKGCWEDFIEQGEEGFTLTPKGKNREVVYRCQPFWYKIEQGKNYGPVFVSVAAQPLDGYTLAPMFKNGTDYVYRPSFELALDINGAPHSRAGLKPFEGNAAAVLSTARKFSQNARVETTKEWFSDYLLLLVEFGRRDLHNVMHGYWHEGIYPESYYTMIDDKDVAGLSVYETPPFSVGDQCLLIYDDYRQEHTEQRRIVTLHRIYYLDDGAFLLDFGLTDMEDLLNNCVSFNLRRMPINTGVALATVTNATSGTAGYSTDAVASIVWRGKENPWGNTGSFMCDVIYEVGENSLFYPFVIDDISLFDGTKNAHYRCCLPSGYVLSAYAGKLLTGYLITDAPHVWLPASDSFHDPEKYWGTFMYVENDKAGTHKFFRVGGNSRKEVCINHGTFELFSEGKVGEDFGGRLILEGGQA